MQLKLDEHFFLINWCNFGNVCSFINEKTISVKKSPFEHRIFLFFSNLQIYLFPLFSFENSILEYIPTNQTVQVYIVARLELIILPFWQRPAEIGEIISISCGEEGGSSAPPPPPHRSVAASAWRSQQGEVTWVRPEKISSIPSTDYGHTMTKFLILSGPKSTPTPNYIFGIWI